MIKKVWQKKSCVLTFENSKDTNEPRKRFSVVDFLLFLNFKTF